MQQLRKDNRTVEEGMNVDKNYLLGIDVGTTGTKVIVFDLTGTAVSSAYQEYTCSYPRAGWVEQDCNLLIETVYACCKKAVTGIADGTICGIGISAQRSSTVFLDEWGKPIKMISWLDNRAPEEVEEIAAKIGREKFYEITGLPLCATWMLPKILHTRKHEPEVWKNTRKIVQLQDVILHALGADGYASDEPEACFFGLWDSRGFCYSEELLQCFDIDRELLPEIRPSGTLAGRVSAGVAERTGLVPGTPLCVGIGDQNSAAIGAGIVEKGMISVSIGTGGLATALLDTCYRDPLGQAMVTNHAIHGMWTFEGLQNAAAGAFRWFRDEIAAYEHMTEGDHAYEAINRMIEDTPVGAKGLLMLPFFAGSAAPRWNNEAKGCFLGLTLGHDRACMARACVEGITLEQKDIMNSISVDGLDFQCVRIVGGATNSEVWNQIQADIYQLPCETLVVKDAAALGAAICAGAGIGIFSSIAEGAEKMVKVNKRYEPNKENAKKYEELYRLYCNTYHALTQSGIFSQIEKLQRD